METHFITAQQLPHLRPDRNLLKFARLLSSSSVVFFFLFQRNPENFKSGEKTKDFFRDRTGDKTHSPVRVTARLAPTVHHLRREDLSDTRGGWGIKGVRRHASSDIVFLSVE